MDRQCVKRWAVMVSLLCLGSVAAADAPDAVMPPELPPLPGIEIDREAGHIEIEAEVVNQEADWLELLVCSPRTREYESILTSPARPSHIHLALLMLDLEPGAPLSWREQEREREQTPAQEQGADGDAGRDTPVRRYVVVPPTGPVIEIYAIWEDAAGERQEAPANDWVRNQLTDEPLAENRWLFAGSVFHRFDEAMPAAVGERGDGQAADEGDDAAGAARRPVYMADLNGTIASLVNFGDDLLARHTTTTNRNDEQAWSTRPERIPPEGTAVTLRLVPTGERIEADAPPADQPLAPDTPFVPPSAQPSFGPVPDD